MKSERTLAKIAGLTMVLVAGVILLLSSFFIAANLLSVQISIFEVASLILLNSVLLGILALGLKLLIYESVRSITVDEIRKRGARQSNRRKLVYNPIVISLSGINGSGKSTQLELVAKSFEERQLAYKYVRLRQDCFISYLSHAVCRILGYAEWRVNPREKKRYKVYSFHKNAALAKIWPYFFTPDLLAISFLRAKIQVLKGNFVLYDRCEIDALVDLVVETKNYRLPESIIGRLLLSISQKDRAAYVIDTDEEKAYRRKKDVPCIDDLRGRRQLYLDLAKTLMIPILNGNKGIEDTHQQFLEEFFYHCPFWYIGSSEEV